MVAGETGIEAKRLVFVDECGANISLVPMYAWSRRGERAPAKAPRNWGKNVTLLSSMSIEGMGPSLAVEGATTRGVFETYLEGVLAPTLLPGQVVVMDNLSAHKGGRVREIVEERGCELLYLPPYSPDLNPIEEAFPSSRGCSGRAGPGAVKLWWKRWAGLWTLSRSQTPEAFSATAVTVHRSSLYDRRFSFPRQPDKVINLHYSFILSS